MKKLLLVIGLLIFTISLFFIINEVNLNQVQEQKLIELNNAEGDYDEQTIVLNNTNKADALKLAEKLNAKLRITKDETFATLTLPKGINIKDVFSDKDNRKYLSMMNIDYHASITEIEEENTPSILRPDYSVSDSNYQYQTYLDYINMQNVWTITKGSNVTVAVIDTGIDYQNPEFNGRISEYSYNATEDKIVKDYLLEDSTYDWSLIQDQNGHGTSVAGVIGAGMNDGYGITGIAPNVELLVIKAECDENGSFARTSDLVFGLYYAIERAADIVNMSFGTYALVNPFADATKLAKDSDTILVAAAGNDGTAMPMYPAADENVIGVGALAENSFELATYSNYGENVNVVAPGSTYTTVLNNGYEVEKGTSLASPIVTGSLALYLSNHKGSTIEEIKEVLYASSYDLGALGNDFYYGYGVLDVNALVQEEKGTVTFDMLTDEVDDIEQIFVKGHTLQNIPEPERLYQVFDGWYYDIECTEELQLYEDKFHSNLTLYAKWVNEDDGIPYTYVTLDDGTIEIRSYTGKRRYITIPNMIEGKVVSSIGDFAFDGESRLRTVTLPESINNIGIYAFNNCFNLTSINIPDNVKTINDFAFYNNARLQNLSLGSTSKLEKIGQYAFGYTNLMRFELPSTIKQVNGNSFYGNTSLQSITIDNANNYYKSIDGVLYNSQVSKVVIYPAGKKTEYTLPDTVRTIGEYSFAYTKLTTIDFNNVVTIEMGAFINAKLQSLAILDQITSLGERAFAYNFDLKEVTIGKGLKELSKELFSNTYKLENILIPSNIQMLNSSAFSSSGLKEVTFEENSNLLYIGSFAFYNNNLTSISIPSSVVIIDSYAFAYNYQLTNVEINLNATLQSIGSYAFSNTTLKEITLPNNLQSIGSFAFSNTLLKTVTLPASLTNLGGGAFASCSSLTSIYVDEENQTYVDLAGVVYTKDLSKFIAYPTGNLSNSYTLNDSTLIVGENAFYGASKLVNINLNEALTNIEMYAFAYVTNLSSIKIPDNVIQISNYAFYNDYKLTSITFNETSKLPRISYGAFAYTGITELVIPSNVSTMAQGAFSGCKNLRKVTFAKNSKLDLIPAYLFDGAENLEEIIFEKGSQLTMINAHGFEGMNNLRTINFNDAKLEIIDNYAFRYCSSLTNIIFPSTLKEIGRYAFYNAASLTEITLPSGIETIKEYAFYGATNLNIYFDSDNLPLNLKENWDKGIKGYYTGVSEIKTSGDYEYAVLRSGNISIIKYNGSATNIDLTTLDLGGTITTIGSYAFANTKIESIILPETLENIQANAFENTQIKNITLPDSVTFIGKYAFNKTRIENIIISDDSNLTVIEQYAFAKTPNLKTFTIPSSLKTLGSYAFYQSGLTNVLFKGESQLTTIMPNTFASSKLTSITLPDSVTYIDDSAFRDCESLESLTFGNGENIQIMSNAFYNTSIKELYIPANLQYIGEFAFVGLTKLSTITVDENNPNYSSSDGLLYNKDQTKLIVVPGSRTGTITLPKTLESLGFGAFENSKIEKVVFDDEANILTIGNRAFYNAEYLKEIVIPSSVISIDYYAFANCINLEKVTFEAGNALKGVYEGAFLGCMNLKEITLPDTVLEISDYAFYGTKKLTKLPISESSQLMGIYQYAFAYSGIKELNLPETVIDLGNYAFQGSAVEKVVIKDTNKLQLLIGLGVFADCNNIKEITIPFIGSYFEDEEITWFGYLFGAGSYEANEEYVPDSLKEVTITDGITFVGKGAFYQISTIEQINLPHSITNVYVSAFFNTTAKFEFTNEIYFEYNAFVNSGITGKLVINENVSESNIYFSSCINLEEVVLPSSIISISSWAFGHCSNLKKIKFSNELINIGHHAFYNCSNLISIEIPSSVTSIGNSAFYECSNLINISFEDNCQLIAIENEAFRLCNSLSSIKIPSSVTSIGSSAFYGCSSLYQIINNSDLEFVIGSAEYGYIAYYAKVIIDKEGNKTYLDESTGFEVIDTEDDFRFIKENDIYKLVAYIGTKDTITLPLDINGNEYEIYQMKGVKNVIIPEGITNISSYAFSGCSSLTSIEIPSTVTSIGGSAFSSCSNLIKIIVNKNNKIYDSRDNSNSIIETKSNTLVIGCKNTIISSSVTSIGSSAFKHCVGLTSITIPNSVINISYNAFWGCISLESITFEGNSQLTSIGSYAFYLCSSLTNIEIPEGVTKIESAAFQDCTNLTSVRIPDSIITIGSSVFSYCTKLREVVIRENEYFAFDNGLLIDIINEKILFIDNYINHVIIPSYIINIDSNLFSGNNNIKTVLIHANVISIGSSAFARCSNLESVIFEENSKLTSIGGYAFAWSPSLNSIEIPSKVTSIGIEVFSGCSGLNSIIVSSENLIYDSRENCNAIIETTTNTLVAGCQSTKIPNSVTSIGDSAFNNCNSLTSIELPSSVTTIGGSAFRGCSSLTSIEIPNSVTSIGNYAFNGCGSLYLIINYSDLEFVIGSAEYGYIAYYAKVIIDKEGNKTYLDESTGFEVIDTEDDFRFIKENDIYKLVAYIGTKDTITLPLDINGNEYEIYQMKGVKNVIIPEGITNISSYAFSGCSSLTSIEIPSTVTSIGGSAFSSCSNLESIIFEENNQLTDIGQFAFSDTAYYNNQENWKNGCLIIGNNLIEVDENMKNVVITNNITCIATAAFLECNLLTNVTISAFNINKLNSLSNLKTLIISDGIIGSYTIYQLNQLTLENIIIKKGVTIRDEYAFNYVYDKNIYLEYLSDEIMWDEDYPNWHNGNTVYYADKWISAEFYDENGNLLSSNIYSTNEVIKQPIVELLNTAEYTYWLEGWDLDGDGIVDNVPVTSNNSFTAYAVIGKELNEYIVNFYDKDQVTILYSLSVPYGSSFELPDNPSKKGYTFLGWDGYNLDMVVTEDVSIYSNWEHEGDGHKYDEGVLIDATCEVGEHNLYTCSICDETYQEFISEALGHEYTVTTILPTCVLEGYDLHTCSRCNYSYQDNEVEWLGHTLGEWLIDVDATCTTDGLRHKECSLCDYIETEVIKAHGHNYEVIETIESTCSKQGKISYECSHCSSKKEELLPLSAHEYEKKYVSKSWLRILIELLLNIFYGYEGENAYYYECSNCKHVQTLKEAGNASAQSVCEHELGDMQVIRAANCEEEGIEGRYCTKCNSLVEAYVTSKTEHTYEYVETVKPDYLKQVDGYDLYRCTFNSEHVEYLNIVSWRTLAINLVNGAAIRTESPAGIRFEASVPEFVDGMVVGMIFGNGVIAVDDLTIDTAGIVYATLNEVDEKSSFRISMVNIPERAFNSKITVRAFVKIQDEYLYSSNVVTRSIYEVALSAKEQGIQNEYIDYVISVVESQSTNTINKVMNRNTGMLYVYKNILLGGVLINLNKKDQSLANYN